MKLQIHQHSLLTRKVFSWHSSSTQVFITGSSSKLDIIIITAPAISSEWCYLSILLVIGSSTDPSLFHVGCRPILHVGLYQKIQPFFMFNVGLSSARTSSTEPTLFHAGCSALPLQGLPLQSWPFFMLDVVPCLCMDFLYRANPFSCWM